MKQARIAYYSGTGNSHQVARWVSETLSIPSTLDFIDDKLKYSPMNQDELLITIAPTHGFTISWSLFKFLLKLPKSRGSNALTITTRAGWKIGPLFLFGLSGSSNFIVSLILYLKGFRVRGMLAVDMPSNWLTMHWKLHPHNIEIIFKKAKVRTVSFINEINKGKRVLFNLNNSYELIVGLLLLRISLIYLFFARLFFSKSFFAGKDCTSCNLCSKECPAHAITMYKGRPFWSFKCESCMRCVANCPTKTINAAHPWLILVFITASVPVATYLGITNLGLTLLTSLAFTLIVAWTLYFWLYFLSRLPFLDKIFTYTSLSHYFRR